MHGLPGVGGRLKAITLDSKLCRVTHSLQLCRAIGHLLDIFPLYDYPLYLALRCFFSPSTIECFTIKGMAIPGYPRLHAEEYQDCDDLRINRFRAWRCGILCFGLQVVGSGVVEGWMG